MCVIQNNVRHKEKKCRHWGLFGVTVAFHLATRNIVKIWDDKMLETNLIILTMAAQTSLSWESFSSLPSLGKLRALSPCTKIVGNIICFCYNNSVSLDTKISESFDFLSLSESFSLFELKRCKVYKINNIVNYI